MRFILNQQLIDSDRPRGMPVLDYLRSEARLVGTKEGCREGDCGACVVLIGRRSRDGVRYQSATSCLMPLADVEGAHVVTVEGLNQAHLNPVQQAMVDEGAVQCGFCTPGIVVAIAGFMLSSPGLTIDDGIAAVEGNICRCTGYSSIRRALSRLIDDLAGSAGAPPDRVRALVATGYLPAYFEDIDKRLEGLPTRPPEEHPRPGQRIVAGGTDLYVQLLEEVCDLDDNQLFMVSAAGLDDIWLSGEDLYIGGAASTEDILHSPAVAEVLPELAPFLRLVSSQPIRNRASLAGNLVNASPIGDLSVILLAVDAKIALGGGDGLRVMPLRRFFTGYKQLVIEPGELVRWVKVPRPGNEARFNFEKVSKRTHLDIATVNSAALITARDETIAEAHVAVGGVAPIPLYLEQTSAGLVGSPITADTVHRAALTAAAEVTPIGDVRGSAGYRRQLVRQLVYAHCHEILGIEEGLP